MGRGVNFLYKKRAHPFLAIAGELFSFAYQSRRSGSFIPYYITIVKEVSKKHSFS